MLKKFRNKFRKIKYLKQKKKLVLVWCCILLFMFISFGLLGKAYASYQTSVKLNADIDQALYVFSGEKMSFNIDTSKIVPSYSAYTYSFTVSNYEGSKHSDMNLEYTIDVKSTTNLPITLKMYRTTESSVDLLSSFDLVQDSDGSWYRVYKTSDVYTMAYNENAIHKFKLEITFPIGYAQDTTYADAIENIEITLKSRQAID